MKKTNKILSLLLAVVMLFSAVSLSLCASAFTPDAKKLIANPENGLIQASVSDGNNAANRANATVIVDLLEELLRENGDKMEVDLKVAKLTIDLTTVNGLLKSIDMVADVADLLKGLSGSLKSLNVKNWVEGQSREKSGDLAVLNNVITFLIDNRAIVGEVVDGSFRLGKALFVFDVDALVKSTTGIDSANLIPSLLGEKDGVYGVIKTAVAKLIYPNYKNAASPDKQNYEKCVKKTLDEILNEDVLGEGLNTLLKKADDALKGVKNESLKPIINDLYSWGFKLEGIMDGFKFNEGGNDKLTLDGTIAKIADIIYTNNRQYLKKLLITYGADLQNAIVSTPYGAPFASLLKFNTFTELSNFDFLNFTSTKSIKGLNNFAGQIVKGVTTYTAWNNAYNLGKNFENLVKWALNSINKTGTPFEKYNFSGDNTQYALALAQMIVNSISTIPEEAKKALDKCKSAEEVVTKLVPIVALDKNGNKLVGSKADTWEKVCGDILGSYLSDVAPLYTDANKTKKYVKFSGQSVWDVLNYAANYYLIDLGLGNMLGVKLSKSDSFLSKLDKLQAVLMAGLEYSKFSTLIPAVCKAVFNLDFNTLVGKGIEESFTNINKTVTTANLAFDMIRNVLKGVFGKNVFTTEKFVSLDKIIQNKELGATLVNILSGLDARKSAIMPVLLYAVGTLEKTNVFTYTVGDNGAVTVKYGKETLKNGTDYKVSYTVKEKNVSGTVKITGAGNFGGAYSAVSKCTKHVAGSAVATQKATLTAEGTLTTNCRLCGAFMKTDKIACAKTFTLSATKFAYTGKEIKPTVTVKDSKGNAIASSNYTVSYKNNKNVGTATVTVTFKGDKYTGTKNISFTIVPAQVTGLKASTVTTTSIKLTWTKVTGAKYYKVEQSTDGKKWKAVATVSTNSATVKKLKAGTKYQFRVTALDSTKKLIGKASSVLKTGTLTKAPTLTLKSTKSKAATASWKKVTGASKYVVYKSTDGKKWTKVTTTTKTSYNLTKLAGGKKIYVKVTALNAYSKASAASSVKKTTVKK